MVVLVYSTFNLSESPCFSISEFVLNNLHNLFLSKIYNYKNKCKPKLLGKACTNNEKQDDRKTAMVMKQEEV